MADTFRLRLPKGKKAEGTEGDTEGGELDSCGNRSAGGDTRGKGGEAAVGVGNENEGLFGPSVNMLRGEGLRVWASKELEGEKASGICMAVVALSLGVGETAEVKWEWGKVVMGAEESA